MDDSDKLNYYLKNASTHATIIVAVVFGLFSILSLMRNIEDLNSPINLLSFILFNFVYLAFLLLGCYNIVRWKFFRSKALDCMKEIDGWRDHDWKNERLIKIIEWFFNQAIIIFYVIGVCAWVAVTLLAFSPQIVAMGTVFYVTSGLIAWIVYQHLRYAK